MVYTVIHERIRETGIQPAHSITVVINVVGHTSVHRSGLAYLTADTVLRDWRRNKK